MTQRPRRIGISTGGGDCPGLNAVIQAAYQCASQSHGIEVLGIEDGLEGLMDLDYKSPHGNRWLNAELVAGIRSRGGTILGTSNKSHPFRYAVRDADGTRREVDLSARVRENFDKLGLEGLLMVGGDGSMEIAARLTRELGIPVVGVPKTIDNDLLATDYTFGFDTAVNIATEAIDRIHTTAASHDRVMLVEVMGRHAGFIALHAGIAGDADMILLPELPYDLEKVVARIEARRRSGCMYTLVVVSEGARPAGGEVATLGEREAGKAVRLGGAAQRLESALVERIEQEVRTVVLGHIQRGGAPTARDRVLATRYGVAAMELVAARQWGRMVALRGTEIVDVPLDEAVGRSKQVDLDGQLISQARCAGIDFAQADT